MIELMKFQKHLNNTHDVFIKVFYGECSNTFVIRCSWKHLKKSSISKTLVHERYYIEKLQYYFPSTSDSVRTGVEFFWKIHSEFSLARRITSTAWSRIDFLLGARIALRGRNSQRGYYRQPFLSRLDSVSSRSSFTTIVIFCVYFDICTSIFKFTVYKRNTSYSRIIHVRYIGIQPWTKQCLCVYVAVVPLVCFYFGS